MTRKQHGAALVELALVLPLLLLATFITTEYSRALYQYNVLTKSVRDAARYLSTQTPGDTSKYATARNLAVYGNPAGTGSPLALGLTIGHVATPVWQTRGTSPVVNTVTVQIGDVPGGVVANVYTFRPMFSSVFGVTFGSATFAPIKVTMRAAL
jgi:Flp pilus assembly protein TadG